MKGAIFFSSKYGSTEQYANWIAEATGLPVFNVDVKKVDPSKFDFIILGSPIIYYKLYIRKWVKKNWLAIKNKPIIFFTVSGAAAGPKLEKWFANSLPEHMVSKMKYVALRGRQKPEELSWWDRRMLIIASMLNKDSQSSKEEFEGFDYMDKSSIKPILEMVSQLQKKSNEMV